MTRRYRDPEAPEVLEAVLERIRTMTRDEWLQELTWRPQGAEETWRMQRLPDPERQDSPLPEPLEVAPDSSSASNPELIPLAGVTGQS